MKATDSHCGCNTSHGAVFQATTPLGEGMHKHRLSYSDEFQFEGSTKDIILQACLVPHPKNCHLCSILPSSAHVFKTSQWWVHTESMTSALEKAGLFWIYFVINMTSLQLSLVLYLRIPSQAWKTTRPWCLSVTHQWVKVFWSGFCFSVFFPSPPPLGLRSLSRDFQEMSYISVISLMLYWSWRSFNRNPLSPLEGWLLLHCCVDILCRTLVAFIWYMGSM